MNVRYKRNRQDRYSGEVPAMTIGDRIFERLGEIGMTQKEFSEKTGIPQSTISEWKSKEQEDEPDIREDHDHMRYTQCYTPMDTFGIFEDRKPGE